MAEKILATDGLFRRHGRRHAECSPDLNKTDTSVGPDASEL
jgi:hypothetical protein